MFFLFFFFNLYHTCNSRQKSSFELQFRQHSSFCMSMTMFTFRGYVSLFRILIGLKTIVSLTSRAAEVSQQQFTWPPKQSKLLDPLKKKKEMISFISLHYETNGLPSPFGGLVIRLSTSPTMKWMSLGLKGVFTLSDTFLALECNKHYINKLFTLQHP